MSVASPPTPEEILELTQQRMAARMRAERAEHQVKLGRNDRIWRYAFLGFAGVLLLGLLLYPGTPMEWRLYSIVHGVCGQRNNIFLGGMQFPLCARNSGIYISFLVTVLFLGLTGRARAGKIPSISLIVLLGFFVIIMGIDGFNSLFTEMRVFSLYQPQNELRTLSGLGMGVAIGTLLMMVFNLALRGDLDEHMPLLRWRDLGAILLIDIAIFLIIFGNVGFMFWPLAVLAFLGITGVLYIVNVVVIGIAMGYDNSITKLRQLVHPATIALGTTGLMLASLSWLRFWIEKGM